MEGLELGDQCPQRVSVKHVRTQVGDLPGHWLSQAGGFWPQGDGFSGRALAWEQGVHQSKSGKRYHLERHGGLRMWVAMKGWGLPPPQSGMGEEGLS